MRARSIFECLREEALKSLGEGSSFSTIEGPDVIPLEETLDGWYCLTEMGMVAHVATDGGQREDVPKPLAVALLGAASRKFRLASWFIPRCDDADVCGSCRGTGFPTGLSEALRNTVTCRCGGLGWVPLVEQPETAQGTRVQMQDEQASESYAMPEASFHKEINE
jgi:hypothetical protein